MNRIYCGDCKKFLVKEKTGFSVKLEGYNKLYVRGDFYVCPGCGKEVFGDFGEPVSLMFKPEREV